MCARASLLGLSFVSAHGQDIVKSESDCCRSTCGYFIVPPSLLQAASALTFYRL